MPWPVFPQVRAFFCPGTGGPSGRGPRHRPGRVGPTGPVPPADGGL